MSVRKTLYDAVQGTIAIDDDMPEGAVLMGFVLVAEWMAPDGVRWLSAIDSGPTDDALPEWQRQGYLHSELFTPCAQSEWETSEDDED